MTNIRIPSLLRFGSVVLAVATTAATAVGWFAMEFIEASSTLTPGVAAAAEPSDDLLIVVDDTIDEVRSALGVVAEVSDRLADSTDDVAGVVEGVGEVTRGRLPEALQALEEAMPALIDTAAIIDDTLRTLSGFGVPYQPEVPFDDALRRVQSELDGLPEAIAAQGEELEALIPRIRATGDATAELGERIAAIDENLAEAQATIEDYRATVEGIEGFTDVSAQIASSLPAARVALAVMAGAGLLLAVTAWLLAGRMAAPVEPH